MCWRAPGHRSFPRLTPPSSLFHPLFSHLYTCSFDRVQGYYEAKKQWTGNFTWSDGQELVLNRRYDLKKQIGHGAFGVVMHAIDLQTGESVAIKIIKARNAYVGYHHIPTKTSHLKSGTYQQSPYMPADRQHKQKTINQPTTSQIYRASAARDSAAAESTLGELVTATVVGRGSAFPNHPNYTLMVLAPTNTLVPTPIVTLSSTRRTRVMWSNCAARSCTTSTSASFSRCSQRTSTHF